MIAFVEPRFLLGSLLTHIPGLHRLASRRTGGSSSARYCYSVWLRHLVMAHNNGLPTQPDIVAELGPGDSLGVGLAALLSGASAYYAFDLIAYADAKRNLEVLEGLIRLFKERRDIPDESEFPNLKPPLGSYAFPRHILTNDRLDEALEPARIESIRTAIRRPGIQPNGGTPIRYFAPWHRAGLIQEESVDWICSQAVLEHVDDLLRVYEAMHLWLRPGGFMSHQIDFKAHGTATVWNGHWTFSDFTWQLMKGRRPYVINRQPYSAHLDLLRRCEFEIVCGVKYTDVSSVQRKHLAPRFRSLSDDDLTTSGAFIQATKPRGMGGHRCSDKGFRRRGGVGS